MQRYRYGRLVCLRTRLIQVRPGCESRHRHMDCSVLNTHSRFHLSLQVTELLMTCILYIVLCGDLMVGSFPDSPIDQRSWIMIFTMILLPCAFLRDLRSVSMLSFWCTMAHLFINVIILGYCLLCAGDWGWGKVSWSINMDKFPVTMGIVVFSYTSQIFLPSLEGSMIDRSKFHCMLNWSHIAAAMFKGDCLKKLLSIPQFYQRFSENMIIAPNTKVREEVQNSSI